MEFENLLVERSDGVAIVTINRPKALNALNAGTLEELLSAVTNLEKDEQVKAIILTGSGSKAFVAGGDISFMQSLQPIAAREFAHLGQKVFGVIEALAKPVIAAVNGFALGGGCELAMACDFRLAGENARFGQPEVNLGVIPGFGGSQRLPRLVGKGRAKELLFTGDLIDSREAWRIGLVNRVVPQEALLATAREIARKIADKGPLAVRLCKHAVNNGLEMESEKGCAYEAELFALCFATEDRAEGMRAFIEKRPATFLGR
ncbi:enoyl-CoA hydratase-related protein [Geobacter argillaceus]|uniref:Enoyl-CoA hydratase n=1 Tax=Geobacter argillaceus TaxID=345631 RepID=A0A562WSF7_9BACT|nr:enoyl-CoA hydratase-related protein [Geobacter argillaceus]TWJ33433.1 enoyl-CoA hydratase [Geobacter argillaceus]